MDVHQVDVPFDVFDVPVVHQIFLMYKLTSIRTSNGSQMLGGKLIHDEIMKSSDLTYFVM